MLVVSKFHDYYDSIMKCGIDKTIVYNRKTEPIKPVDLQVIKDCLPSVVFGGDLDDNQKATYQFGWVMFCGKVYPVCRVNYHVSLMKKEEIFCYSMKEINVIIKKLALEKKQLCGDKVLNNLFDRYSKADCTKALVNYNVPIIGALPVQEYRSHGHWRGNEVIINPCLKDIEFYKAVDPYSAFQSISSFISGVLTNVEKDLVKIDDKSMRAKKGFDDWSFKTRPGTKKKKK